MANIKSAVKRNKQNERRRLRNRAYRTRLRTAVKKLRTVVDSGDASAARELLSPTLALIDSIAQKKVIHHNTADRTKSRLTVAVAKLEA